VAKLPIVSARECVKALGKIGFYVVRQKGSHITMRRATTTRTYHSSKSQNDKARYAAANHQ
jgi:predicted RNA binding protein YcfA (HicA-like mRNA interferase family)